MKVPYDIINALENTKLILEMITLKRFVSITLVLMLVFALAVSVCANAAEDNGSPTPDEYLYMTAKAVGDGEASVNPDKVILGSGDTVTFTATEKGGKFIKWELHCEYDIISGSLTDKVPRPTSKRSLTLRALPLPIRRTMARPLLRPVILS